MSADILLPIALLVSFIALAALAVFAGGTHLRGTDYLFAEGVDGELVR